MEILPKEQYIQNSHDTRDNILFPQEEPRLESDSL